MSIFKHSKAFFISSFLVFILLGVSFVVIIFNVEKVLALQNEHEKLKIELQALIAASPSPIKKNVSISTENLQKIQKFRQGWDRLFKDIECSKTAIDCYLNIQTEIEALKEQARIANVSINSNCCFGFSKYLNAEKFPDAKNLQELDRQCKIISLLSEMLIKSKPLEIISFTREPLNGETDSMDLFDRNSLVHLDIHNIFYSNIFKLSFTGTTQSLRLYINKIQHMQIPIFIRDIEVSSQVDSKTKQFSSSLPLFSITLEIIDFNPV
ncbi:MAG: hypothetical protein C5B43_04950 [Verrucomicrobia bacterium]|nr:MAG: hypothetical protein C5B43_04950 [Verrucomicrobiota bacterium]